jgi:spore germination protein KB
MIEKGRISAYQMAVMMYPTIVATAILIVPAISSRTAGRDMWISPVWGALTGLLTVLIVWKLNKLYPKETIIEYSVSILGKWLGKALGLIYILFYLHVNGIILREYSDFVTGAFLIKTPMIVVLAGMALVCGMAVRAGLEVVGRASEFFGPIVVVLYLLIIILILPELDFSNIVPMFEFGLKPSILGAAAPQAWFSEFMLIAFLLPYIVDRDQSLKWSVLSVLAVMGTMIITNFAALLLFGVLVENLGYPLMSAARYISIADFFEHVESVVMALWVAGAFIKITVFYYAIVLGTAQWLNLKSYKPIVFPIGLLLTLLGLWSAATFTEMKDVLGKAIPFYLTSFQTFIPFLLLVLAYLKQKLIPTMKKNQQSKSQ